MLSPETLTSIKKHKPIVSGSAIDRVGLTNDILIKRLQQEVKTTDKENEELRYLNHRLVERVEYLQLIIDQEASANTYYYHYPPNPDYTGKFDESKSGKKTFAQSEHDKIKRMFEDQIEFNKKNHEKETRSMKESMAGEIEDLHKMFSNVSKELVAMTSKNSEVEQKFR